MGRIEALVSDPEFDTECWRLYRAGYNAEEVHEAFMLLNAVHSGEIDPDAGLDAAKRMDARYHPKKVTNEEPVKAPSDREIREGGGGADYTRDGCERGAFDDETKVPFNLLEKDLCKNLNLLSINEQRKAAANQIARDGWTAFFDLCELLTRGLHEITFRIHQEDVTCFLHGPWAGIPAAGRGKDMTVAFQRAAQVARKCLDYMDREKDNLSEEERQG